MALPSNVKSFKNLIPDVYVDGKYTLDFWNAWRVASTYLNSTKLLDEYVVEDGVTWHDIADTIYYDRELWWIIPLFNEVENPFLIFSESSLKLKNRKLKILNPIHLNGFLQEVRSFRIKKEKE